ncbi:MAG: Maf family protein [Bacteroidales bacterium]|nr:Maf family protein [Bacteroidales bacterium]
MLLDELKNYKVYLASKSPRRRELLTDMGIDFEILAAEVEESFDPTLPSAVRQPMNDCALAGKTASINTKSIIH